MMQVNLVRTPAETLVPLSAEDASWIHSLGAGEIVHFDVSRMRNGRFFRKWWALVTVGFDLCCEFCPPAEHNGEPIQPNFERFRKDVTILAGFFDIVANYQGEARVEAKSISFAKMEEDEFAKLYDKTIDVLLQKVLPDGCITEARLRAAVDDIMSFA